MHNQVKSIFINYDVFETSMIFKLWSPSSLSFLGTEALRRQKSIEDYAIMRNQVSRWLHTDEKLAVEFLFNLNYHDGVNKTLKVMAKLAFRHIVKQEVSEALQIIADIILVLKEEPSQADPQFMSQVVLIENKLIERN